MPNEDNLREQEKRDCVARTAKAVEELNELLKKAAELGVEQEITVMTAGGVTETRDLSPLPPNVIYRFPTIDRQPAYRQVVVQKAKSKK